MLEIKSWSDSPEWSEEQSDPNITRLLTDWDWWWYTHCYLTHTRSVWPLTPHWLELCRITGKLTWSSSGFLTVIRDWRLILFYQIRNSCGPKWGSMRSGFNQFSFSQCCYFSFSETLHELPLQLLSGVLTGCFQYNGNHLFITLYNTLLWAFNQPIRCLVATTQQTLWTNQWTGCRGACCTSFCCLSSSFILISRASALAARFAASLASAWRTQINTIIDYQTWSIRLSTLSIIIHNE